MTRVSKLSTDEEFCIEERRESLRNQRLKRACLLLITLAGSLAVAGDTIHPLLSVLLRLLVTT